MMSRNCCARCGDAGTVATKQVCPECAGQPFVNLDGHTMVCQHCHGTGCRNEPCPDCQKHKH